LPFGDEPLSKLTLQRLQLLCSQPVELQVLAVHITILQVRHPHRPCKMNDPFNFDSNAFRDRNSSDSSRSSCGDSPFASPFRGAGEQGPSALFASPNLHPAFRPQNAPGFSSSSPFSLATTSSGGGWGWPFCVVFSGGPRRGRTRHLCSVRFFESTRRFGTSECTRILIFVPTFTSRDLAPWFWFRWVAFDEEHDARAAFVHPQIAAWIAAPPLSSRRGSALECLVSNPTYCCCSKRTA